MKEDVIATNTRYPKHIHDAVAQLALQHKRSFNAEVMWALEQYIQQEEGRPHVSSEKGEDRQDRATH